MTRYADPRRCPDCSGPLATDDTVCPSCGLPLRGRTAAELFATLTTADALLAALRENAAPGTVAEQTARLARAGAVAGGGAGVPAAAHPAGPMAGAAAGPSTGPATWPVAGPHPGPVPGHAVGPVTGQAGGYPAGGGPGVPGLPATSAAPAPRRGLSAASVPKILLGLGALCLLVAALVFLAVTWSVMGVGGRTATLVGFTAVTAALATWMCRRDLRGAAEALSLVSLGLLTLDVFGARSAGWLGDVSTPWFLVLLGGLLGGAGVGAALLARRTPVGGLVAPELVAGGGIALLTVGVADLDASRTGLMLVVATLLAAVAAWAAARVRLLFTGTVAAVVAVLAWAGQLLHALDAVSAPTFAALWGRGEVVELLMSAVLAGALVLVRDLPRPARVSGGALGLTVLAVAVTIPAFDESATVLTLTGLAVLVVASGLARLLPTPWGLTAVLTMTVAGMGELLALALVVTSAGVRFAEVTAAGWAGRPGDLLPPVTGEAALPAPWLAPLVVVVLFLSGAALSRASAALDEVVSAVTDLRVGLGIVAGAAVTTLVSYPVPVWTVLAALLAVAAGFLGWWRARPSVAALVVAAVYLLAAAAVGAYDEWFTVAATTAVLLAAGLVHLRAVSAGIALVAGALAPVALAGDVWAWGALVEAGGTWTALVGLLLLAATALSLPLYPALWWSSEASTARTGVEVGAAAVAVPLGLAGVTSATAGAQATWTAVYLTVAGAAVVAQSLLRPDRRALAWPGSGLLVLASWVRLGDLGVTEPEPYTLPAALALVVVGIVRLRRDPEVDTARAVGPGLTLALAPSLLWALDDPMTLRGLLLGLTCLALVLVGLRGRWSAPLVLGAAAGAVLVVRMAAPYVGDAVPRWVLIGAAGALLIATGVTWERRLQEARHLVGYVRAMR